MITSASNKKNFSSLGADLAAFSPDLFITFISFEDRCIKVAEKIAPHVKDAIFCYFDPIVPMVNINMGKADVFFPNALKVKFSHDNPFVGIDNVLAALKEKEFRTKKILIDITTFSKEALLSFISAINFINAGSFENIRFIYNPAANYDDSKHLGLFSNLLLSINNFIQGKTAGENINHSSKRLSFGIKDVRSVLGYLGNPDPLKKIHLIIMVGYEIERSIKVIEEFEPSKLTIGFGKEFESQNSEIYKHNKEAHKKLLNMLSPEYGALPSGFEIETNFTFCLQNPLKAKEEILKIVDDNYNTVIVPMNNKISTLGAGLAALSHKNMQIAYAQPCAYNYFTYSKPSDDYYFIEISNICS